MSLQLMRGQKMAKFALDMRVRFKCAWYVFSSCGFLSAAVSLGHILAQSSYCGNCLQTFHTVSQNGKPNYDIRGQLNHPGTPRMTKNDYLPPCALGAPASDDLSVFEKKFCHFSMVNSQKHHYTNKPTLSTSIHYCVCHCNILMASEGIISFIAP